MADDPHAQAQGEEAPPLGSPGARGYIWWGHVNVAGSQVAVPVPVAYMDRPPEGWEAAVFDYSPADQFTEGWAAINVPAARSLGNKFLDAVEELEALLPSS